MDAFTLADIRSDVRGLLSDDQFDAGLIDQAANWFINELFANYRLRMAESSDTITAALGDTTADLPSDLMTRIAIWMTAPRVQNMKGGFLEYENFMENHANYVTASQAQAYAWTEFGKAMRFAQPLNASHTFQIDYLRAPVKMVNASDECELLSVWSELVAKGTLIGVMRINEDYDEAQAEEDKLAPKVTAFVRSEGRGGGKTGPAGVVRTNRGKVGGYRADRDF